MRGAVELPHGRHHLIALNDRLADGQDVSWIWDVDFEMLRGKSDVVVPTGERAEDMASDVEVRRSAGGNRSLSPTSDARWTR